MLKMTKKEAHALLFKSLFVLLKLFLKRITIQVFDSISIKFYSMLKKILNIESLVYIITKILYFLVLLL